MSYAIQHHLENDISRVRDGIVLYTIQKNYTLRREINSFEGVGRDESERQRAESQRIVAARPLCPLQYPVAYLSRLQRIQLTVHQELYFMAAITTILLQRLSQRHVPLGAIGPYCGSANER